MTELSRQFEAVEGFVVQEVVEVVAGLADLVGEVAYLVSAVAVLRQTWTRKGR